VSLRYEGGRGPGLGPGALFDQEELAAGVVLSWCVQVDDDLERKDLVAEDVAVQGVPTARLVSQQDR